MRKPIWPANQVSIAMPHHAPHLINLTESLRLLQLPANACSSGYFACLLVCSDIVQCVNGIIHPLVIDKKLPFLIVHRRLCMTCLAQKRQCA